MAVSPATAWWQEKVGGLEKTWVALAVLLAVVFFSSWMAIWHLVGRQNAVGQAYRVDPTAFREEVFRFAERYKVAEEKGIPIVAPPPGSDVYLLATRFSWYPILQLKAGEHYRLRITALDVLHGFSLYPHQWSLQLYPGYEWVMPFTPTEPDVYSLVCNDYCGLGHHAMVGKIIVMGR